MGLYGRNFWMMDRCHLLKEDRSICMSKLMSKYANRKLLFLFVFVSMNVTNR